MTRYKRILSALAHSAPGRVAVELGATFIRW